MPEPFGEPGEREDVGAGRVEVVMDGRQLLVDVVQEPVELRVDARRVGLVVDRVEHRFDRGPKRFRGHAHQVRGVVGSAALPCRAGKVRRDRFHQTWVGVGGDQPDPGEATSDQVSEERVPGRAGLRGGDPQPEDLPAAVVVDTGRDQDDGVDHAAAFTDLHRQRVSSHERERSRLIQRPVAELVDVFVEVGGHPGDL